jgi:hypothetical protein
MQAVSGATSDHAPLSPPRQAPLGHIFAARLSPVHTQAHVHIAPPPRPLVPPQPTPMKAREGARGGKYM